MYALLYAGDESDEESDSITPEQAAQSAEAANGRVRSESSPDKSENAAEADESSESTDEEAVQTTAKSTNTSIYLVVGVIALAGVGAAGFFMMKKKKGGNKAVKTEAEFEDETEISEDEEFNFYDGSDEE